MATYLLHEPTEKQKTGAIPSSGFVTWTSRETRSKRLERYRVQTLLREPVEKQKTGAISSSDFVTRTSRETKEWSDTEF